jgi:hypothetical protein
MKGILMFLSFLYKKTSLHMKRKENILKFKTFFEIFFWTFIFVHFLKAWIFYGKSIAPYDKLKLTCGYKKNNFQFVMINLFLKT